MQEEYCNTCEKTFSLPINSYKESQFLVPNINWNKIGSMFCFAPIHGYGWECEGCKHNLPTDNVNRIKRYKKEGKKKKQ